MNRTAKIAVLGAVLLGCRPVQQTPPEVPTRPAPATAPDSGVTSRAKDGLVLSLKLPGRRFVTGEAFKIRVTARNAADRTIKIPAGPGAPICVRIWLRTKDQWDQIKVYPRAAERTIRPWQLAPGARRPFEMILTVEPDWPTHDTVAVVAELNGRPDLQVMQTIRIVAAPDDAGGG